MAAKRKRDFARAVRRITNGAKERKSICTYHGNQTATTAWQYEADMMNVALGDTDITRDGDQIHARFLKMKIRMTVADDTNSFRLILFRNDKNTTPSGLPGTVLGCFEPEFYQKWGPVKYDKTFVLNNNYSGQSVQKIIEFYIPLKHTISYDVPTASRPSKGNYWFAWISDSAVAAHPTLDIQSDFVYNEK